MPVSNLERPWEGLARLAYIRSAGERLPSPPQDLGRTESSNGTTPAISQHPLRRRDATSPARAQASNASEHEHGGRSARASATGWGHHQATVIDYVVDGQGRRVAKLVNGLTVRQWLYKDQLNPVAELDGAGNLTWHYVYGAKPNIPDYAVRVSDGARYRIISDQLGSPVLVVNVADPNDVLLEARYSAFGEQTVLQGAADAVPFGFAGGRYDPDTGLVRFGARDYDPEVGRWMSKDPIGFGGGLDLYTYGGNDPVNRMDPRGEDFEAQVCRGLVLAAAAACEFVCASTFTGVSRICDPIGSDGSYLRCLVRCSQAKTRGLAECVDEFEERKRRRYGPIPGCIEAECVALL